MKNPTSRFQFRALFNTHLSSNPLLVSVKWPNSRDEVWKAKIPNLYPFVSVIGN
ncbi:hypothetical protein Hdeb2414_s0094g00790081 [Helianthus debilis subsp. tardiflorus]